MYAKDRLCVFIKTKLIRLLPFWSFVTNNYYRPGEKPV